MPKPTNLQQTLWDIQKRFGDHAIETLGARGAQAAALATGFPVLDATLSAGGIPYGTLTELVGIPTSGMTTLAHQIIANTHRAGNPAVYLDPNSTFDPDYAARCGVEPDRLLLVRPTDAAQAILIARDCVRTGSIALVVLDLIGLKVSGIKPLEHLRDALVRSRCTALILHDTPFAAPLDSVFDVRLCVERTGWLFEGRDVRGYQARITVAKDKGREGERHVVVDIRADRAVDGGNP